MINVRTQKSFTLIELLVVIVIIGILAGVIMISTSSSINKANIAKLKVFNEGMRNSMLLNLVSEWGFDNITDYNTSTKIVGSTVNNIPDSWGTHHGTALNGPLLKEGEDCVYDKCLYFNGTNHIAINITVDGTEAAISLWVKDPSGSYILRSNANVRTYIYGSGSFLKGDPQVHLGSTSYSKEWTHVVTTWKKENGQLKGKIFVNGLPLSTDFINFSAEQNGTYIAIMSFTTGGEQFGLGTVDDVKYYNAVLSSSQIKQNYIAGLDSLLSNGNISKEEHNEKINALAYDKYE